jgi:hypothetical protein
LLPGTDVLDIVSRLVGRPFLTSTASQRLKQLEKMLSTADAIPDASRLLDSLKAALCEAEGVLDDIEHQHLCLQGLMMSYQDDKKNLVRKLLLDVKCSRFKSEIEKRLKKVESIIKKGFLFSCPRIVSCTQFSPAA